MATLFMQDLDLISELLKRPETTTVGGFSLGLITALAARDKVAAPESLLEAAVTRQDIAEAVELYKTCEALRARRAGA